MKLLHIHKHLPSAFLSLNVGQILNPLNGLEQGALPLGAAPRQTEKGSSSVNSELNLASHISINTLNVVYVPTHNV